jgi:hypothetical protein
MLPYSRYVYRAHAHFGLLRAPNPSPFATLKLAQRTNTAIATTTASMPAALSEALPATTATPEEEEEFPLPSELPLPLPPELPLPPLLPELPELPASPEAPAPPGLPAPAELSAPPPELPLVAVGLEPEATDATPPPPVLVAVVGEAPVAEVPLAEVTVAEAPVAEVPVAEALPEVLEADVLVGADPAPTEQTGAGSWKARCHCG